MKNEAANGVRNERGTLSMARTDEIHSATSQFFVNLADNDFLDQRPGQYGYAVFGRIAEGMDVIDRIAKVRHRAPQGLYRCADGRRGDHLGAARCSRPSSACREAHARARAPAARLGRVRRCWRALLGAAAAGR